MASLSLKKEQKLLSQLRAGKKNAVRQWFQFFSPYLQKMAERRIENPHDAEEIVQETFINCLRQLPLFQQRSRLRTWMVSILHHEIADFYRKQYAKKTLQTVPLTKTLLQQSPKNASETAQKVREVFSRMTRKRAELLLQKYVDKRKVVEIAQYWGVTVKAAESELFRARKEFRMLYAQLSLQE